MHICVCVTYNLNNPSFCNLPHQISPTAEAKTPSTSPRSPPANVAIDSGARKPVDPPCGCLVESADRPKVQGMSGFPMPHSSNAGNVMISDDII